MLCQQTVGIASLCQRDWPKQTIYRIKDHPAGAEAALAAWGLGEIFAWLESALS
jgi:hypothetical protein